MVKMDCAAWWAPGWEKMSASLGLVPSRAADREDPQRIVVYLPYGNDFRERFVAHEANSNSMKWMLRNDSVEMADFGMTGVRIGLFQHALAHSEALVKFHRCNKICVVR
jgi:hypothetical protein